MDKPKLLIVDDDAEIRTQMKWALSDDYDVHEAEDRPSAMALFGEHRMPLVSLDLGLPPDSNGVEEGFVVLEELLAQQAGTKVIVITGQGQREHALRAIGLGAYDYFNKPIQIDELNVVLRRARHVYELERENRELQKNIDGDSFQGIVGFCEPMQNVFKTVRRVAGSDAGVLIHGESGTGKELVARAVHRLSSRPDGPFIAINCGAIPENLLESELFGHEKGAFTGAHARRQGRIEMANRGTLFLDEIGELPLSLQVKLLRFLQEHKLERVGGRQEIEVDVRVIAATNTDLKRAMKEDQFREDLYYRLAVVNVSLPPLRDRSDDVIVLAKVFLERFAADNKKHLAGFSSASIASLQGYEWPGNVRELENRVRRAVIMAEGKKLTPEDLELASGDSQRFKTVSLKEAREELERELILRTLAMHDGNMTRTAAALSVSRPTLYELIDKLGIRKADRAAG
jgi:two-component system NtrC family response regulator